jgi:hypothetical protein
MKSGATQRLCDGAMDAMAQRVRADWDEVYRTATVRFTRCAAWFCHLRMLPPAIPLAYKRWGGLVSVAGVTSPYPRALPY